MDKYVKYHNFMKIIIYNNFAILTYLVYFPPVLRQKWQITASFGWRTAAILKLILAAILELVLNNAKTCFYSFKN